MSQRILETAERVVMEELTSDAVMQGVEDGEIEDFYHTILSVSTDEYPYQVWLAIVAAFNALCEAEDSKPLQTQVSGKVTDENGNTIYTRSDTWTDEMLAGYGCHSDDAAVDAAYAFAGQTLGGEYDASKVLQFWLWWLKEGIPNAWEKANNMQA
jgi:hypothetical protein